MPSGSNQFTIRTANQTLPLVKMIVEDVVQFSKKINETRERLDYLNEGRSLENPQDDYSKELKAIYAAVGRDSNKMEQCIQELSDLNILPGNAANGFVDFPAIREDKAMVLCWNLADKEVLHWHETAQDCCHRRPIDLALIRRSGDASVTTP